MIVQMKKVSLIILGDKKSETLKTLRNLGILHIEIAEGSSNTLTQLKNNVTLLEGAISTLSERVTKFTKHETVDLDKALSVARQVAALNDKAKQCQGERITLNNELDRIKSWGDIDPEAIKALSQKNLNIMAYELAKSEYDKLDTAITTLVLEKTKSTVKFAIVDMGDDIDEALLNALAPYKFKLPELSTQKIRQKIQKLELTLLDIDSELSSYAVFTQSMKDAIKSIEKKIEFEIYKTGMNDEQLSENQEKCVSIAHFKGYIEADNVEKLTQTAKSNSWGLVIEDPTEEDNVPTQLKNNKFVSLIYPLTDFLGTVPGYFEYDISGWFLAFILIFFGIIFGDGLYGLLITAVAAIPVIKSLIAKKPVSPTFLLVGLFGISTLIWGTVTCTWCGLPAEQLPQWLQKLSIPVISNVYADKLWHPFWTGGDVGLTTSQNLQIFCFTLALIQLSVAHIKGALRSKGSLKMLGDIGSLLQLFGIYYLVLSLVVNPAVFSFSLVLGGIPIGTVSIALIGIGFALSFIFANYEGSIIKSILSSLINIVSVLLGVVNVFSDIVSYIRLWAVGLAGAAISATVNELAGPLLGNLLFAVLAIILLVFGHGLNMILNVLSVIVHGIRLNTLEFSSHLDMSWSGHKFKPFK
ncbi:MAG: ATPase [Clostridia bacterium]|nr:ATPase [Clostridia bacterium]